MNAKRIGDLLAALETELRRQGEFNWIRGVIAARQAMQHPNGLEEARSIYGTMNEGANSFADYNVWHQDFNERVKLNAEVDRLRQELWSELDL